MARRENESADNHKGTDSALYIDQTPKMRLEIMTPHSINKCVSGVKVPTNPNDISTGSAAQ